MNGSLLLWQLEVALFEQLAGSSSMLLSRVHQHQYWAIFHQHQYWAIFHQHQYWAYFSSTSILGLFFNNLNIWAYFSSTSILRLFFININIACIIWVYKPHSTLMALSNLSASITRIGDLCYLCTFFPFKIPSTPIHVPCLFFCVCGTMIVSIFMCR